MSATEKQSKNTQVFEKRYAQLNAEQKEAVDTIDGPVLVVAGPGSGKTELLSLRVANILYKTDVYPSNILCLTFTDLASVNMRKRLEGLIGHDSYRVAIHTFHSFGAEIINQHPEFFYQGASFSSADDLLQTDVIMGLIESLPHNNPLRSFHPEQGYVYAGHIKRALGALKKSGLAPDEFEKIIEHNSTSMERVAEKINDVFGDRINNNSLSEVFELIDFMRSESEADKLPVKHVASLMDSLASSLEVAAIESEKSGKSTPLSAWKSKHTKKSDGRRILSEQYYIEHMRTLAKLYASYKDEMHSRGIFDFDDMLLDAIQGIENNETLRSELQEQYQYILVDEFQDTNDAQMRFIRTITDNPVFEGSPNIMAVGDDDQAIFKFQGAEISNILNFKNIYKNPKVVTLVKNYRSTQDVLDLSRSVITQGENRLENILPDIEKTLISANKELSKGSINDKRFATAEHERQYVADKILDMIEKGTQPKDIAIIARRHKDLQSMVPLLHARKVPINYEQKQNVFDEPHIHQLITMCRFVASLSRKNAQEADDLLPEILSYPFWELNRSDVWELSVSAYQGNCACDDSDKCDKRYLWLHHMMNSKNKTIKLIAELFVSLGVRAQSEPVEYIIDTLIGAKPHIQSDRDEPDENIDFSADKWSDMPSFKSYYFSQEKLSNDTELYVRFLTGLQTFINALREYKKGKRIKTDDLLEFVDMHQSGDIALINTNPFANSPNSVSLLSAHKAKGLEFDTVFILSCQEDVWASKNRRGLLPFPENLPITPSADNKDDQLRLFYVALTRAKRHLYITSYETDESGKESLKLPFISLDNSKIEKSDLEKDIETISHAWETKNHPPFVADEKSILAPLVKNYQMSVTHLNNFLNVKHGGPRAFLENNILRFPQPKSPSSAYGTAMHATISRLYKELKSSGALPSVDTVIKWFEDEIKTQRLSDKDTAFYTEKGSKALSVYYDNRSKFFDPKHEIEIDFAKQGVCVEGAHLTGKLDKIIKNESDKTIIVSDLKTGNPEPKWSKSSYKLINYKRQLMFYKLLVENSRTYNSYTVNSGMLEFLEPKGDKIVTLDLQINDSDMKKFTKLVGVVYNMIVNLDFPDTSGYSPDAKGVIEFEEDLLN